MAYIPPRVLGEDPFDGRFKLENQGKVRDTYSLASEGRDDLLLVHVTDRVSIFDFVLGMTVENKGAVLNLIAVFFKLYLKERYDMKTDLVAWGQYIDKYLPRELRHNPKFWNTMVIVKRCKMVDYELIVRNRITGSVFNTYAETGKVAGIELPKGFYNGEKLPFPIFTPSSKAKAGHDINLNRNDVVAKEGRTLEDFSLKVTEIMTRVFAGCGLELVDTKIEVGYGAEPGTFEVADELGTPDSSRITDIVEQQMGDSNRKLVQGFDKQYLRNEGKKLSINELDPLINSHAVAAGQIEFPQEVITKTRQLYLEMAKRTAPAILELGDKELTRMTNDLLGS